MTKNQNGFSILMSLLIIVVGVSCGAGWLIWQANIGTDKTIKNTDSSKVSNPQPAVANESSADKASYKIPSGYKFQTIKELGIKFAYPNEFGNLSDSGGEKPGMVKSEEKLDLKTSKPNSPVINGSSDSIRVVILKSSDDEFYTVKYGPTVHFVNDKLIVTDINPADTNNRIGAEYANFFSDANVKSQVNGITIYQITGGDEGTTGISFTFKIDDKVGIILLPAFNDGDSMCPTNDCKHYDIAQYNELAKNILSSIQKI